MGELRQREPRFENRALLNLAYEIDCTLRVDGVCTGGPGEPCHANWSEYGKGKSIKAHDCFYASGCRACHTYIDSGSKASEEERRMIWLKGYIKTQYELWRGGWLKVR